MNTLVKRSFLVMFLLALTSLSAFPATDGGARIEGTIRDYNGSGARHWTVMWVTYNDGTFIKSLRRQGPSWTSTHWSSHCRAWYDARGGSGGSQALDGYSSATAQDYAGTNSPLVWTWNCRDANNNLVPDGTYKFWIQYAEDSGQGPHTTNGLVWVKGPTADTRTYPNIVTGTTTTYSNLRVVWTPVVVPPTTPAIASVQLQGGNLVISGTGGPNSSYYILSTTEANQSTATWTRILTNTFNASGQFSFTTPVSGGPRRFYRVQAF